MMLNGEPFTGECRSMDRDSIITRGSYKNGILDGDSAWTKFYKNGLCKSNLDYHNGKPGKLNKLQYFRIGAVLGGLSSGYVQKDWVAGQDSLKVSLVRVPESMVVTTPEKNLISDPDFDVSGFHIIKFTLTFGCIQSVLIEYTNNSNKITPQMKKAVREAASDLTLYIQDIRCTVGNDTIILPEIRFRLK